MRESLSAAVNIVPCYSTGNCLIAAGTMCLHPPNADAVFLIIATKASGIQVCLQRYQPTLTRNPKEDQTYPPASCSPPPFALPC